MLNEALKKVVAGGSLTEQESADMEIGRAHV